MPNLWSASPVGRGDEGRSYTTRTGGGGEVVDVEVRAEFELEWRRTTHAVTTEQDVREHK